MNQLEVHDYVCHLHSAQFTDFNLLTSFRVCCRFTFRRTTSCRECMYCYLWTLLVAAGAQLEWKCAKYAAVVVNAEMLHFLYCLLSSIYQI